MKRIISRSVFFHRMFRLLLRTYVPVLVCCSSVLTACNSDPGNTVEPITRSLTGNWGSPNYSYASFALVESNNKVSGYGWYGSGIPVTVEGTRSGENVALTLTQVNRPTAPPRSFHGVFANDALVGDIDATNRVSMSRVDTVASSIGDLTFSNGWLPLSDYAQFVWNGSELWIQPTSIFSTSYLIGTPGKLAPGKYSIGTGGIFRSQMGIPRPGGGQFQAVSGELTITTIGSRALMGTFVMTVTNGTASLVVNGSFSASCSYNDLNPQGQRCAGPN